MFQVPLSPSDPLGLPASVEFILFFKTLGYILHVIPMNIFYVGVPLSILFGYFGKGDLQHSGYRLIRSMPIFIALGINFGIVPLLFTQVLFYPAYYTAGILIAWNWLSVIFLLMIAYYGVYLYSYQVKKGMVTTLGYSAGWLSAILFLVIGFLFTNNFSLMTNAEEWKNIFNATNVDGAVTGIALNTNDPTLFPRYMLMLGMAITTTAVWLLTDTFFFAREETDTYKKFAAKLSLILYAIGVVWFGIFGYWYVLETIHKDILSQIEQAFWIKIFFRLSIITGIILLLWFVLKRNSITKSIVWYFIVLQILLITSNAIVRQFVQIKEIEQFMPLNRDVVNWQWSPLVVFLGLFLVGVSIIWWMVNKIIPKTK